MATVKPEAYTWTRKTYQAHADVVKELFKTVDVVGFWEVVKALGDMYIVDNPRFDRERFQKACISNVAWLKENSNG